MTKSDVAGHSDLNAQLPRWEVASYFAVWSVAVSGFLLSVFQASRDYAEHYSVAANLDDGWTSLNVQKDFTDSEWTFWHRSWLGDYGKWMAGYVILSQLLRHQSIFSKRKYFFLIYSMLCYYHVVGIESLILIVIQASIILLIVWLTASRLLVWMAGMIFLLMLDNQTTRTFLFNVRLLHQASGTAFLFQEYGLCMTVMRLISFGCFFCEFKLNARSAQKKSLQDPVTDSKQTCEKNSGTPYKNRQRDNDVGSEGHEDGSENKTKQATSSWQIDAFSGNALVLFVDFLVYIFYVPTFVSGPMMNYDIFYKQFYDVLKPRTFVQLRSIVLAFCRFVLWGFALHFLQHYLYSGSILFHPSLLSVLPLMTISGTGFCYIMLFLIKYVVIWGMCGSVARLDQLDPLGPPACMFCIHEYSSAWNGFDRGLHAFLKQHAYIVLGGSRHGLLRQLFAVSACFGFVAVWHGHHAHIFLWCLTNCITVVIEAFLRNFFDTPFMRNNFSPANLRRVHSLALLPMFCASTMMLMVFFGSDKSGYVIFNRVIIQGFPVSTIVVLVVLYSTTQVSKEAHRCLANRESSKLD